MTVRSMRATSTRRSISDTGNQSQSRTVEIVRAAETSDLKSAARHLLMAREVYAERRRRHKYLPADLFGEPTWDILLDLYIAYREDRRVPTTSSCIGAHVPPTTALRWLRILETRGLVEREDDGRDGRRTFVRLTHRGVIAVDACLASLYLNVARAVRLIDVAEQAPDAEQ